MQTKVGSCPKCVAPIYEPRMWHGVTPPPITYTCGCVEQPKSITTTSTDTNI